MAGLRRPTVVDLVAVGCGVREELVAHHCTRLVIFTVTVSPF